MAGKARNEKRSKRLLRAALELREADAFEPASDQRGNAYSLESARAAMRLERIENRKPVLIFSLVFLVVLFFSLLLPYGISTDNSTDLGSYLVVFSPGKVLAGYATWFQVTVMPLFDSALSNRGSSIIAQFDAQYGTSSYSLICGRVAVTFVVVICGFMLACSGLLFQSVFRNPLAVPSMLGVSDGVTLGSIVFVSLGYSYMSQNVGVYYLCLYGCGVATMLVVLLFARLMSSGSGQSIFDMLLVGTVISQILGGIVNYISNFGMDMSAWNRLYELKQATVNLAEPMTYIIVAVIAIVSFVPVYLLRFRLNLVSYGDDDIRMLGGHPKLLRGGAMILGSFMQLAALASIGQVAMVSLAVPFIARLAFRNEFRSQLLGNFLIGSVILMICEAVQHFAVIEVYGTFAVLPLGTLVAFVIMPFFVWLMAAGRRGWE